MAAPNPTCEPPSRSRAAPVIEPGHTVRLGHRQDQRDRPRRGRRRSAGSSASAIALRAAACCCSIAIGLPALRGHRHLGHQHPGRLGLRHHQLRLVDRHRPRRHADLGDPAAAAAGVAHLDQPLRRGDDAVRRRLRRHVPAAPPGPARGSPTGCFPYPNTMGIWPQFRSPLDLGRVRGLDLRHRLAAVLVRRPDPRPGDAARPRRRAASARVVYGIWRWAGAARRGTGTATRRPTCCSPAWRRRWCSRSTPSSASTSPSAIVPGWHSTIFPPYFVAGAIYSGFAMVLTLAIPLRKFYGLEDFITMRHLENMAKVMLATGLIVAYGYMMEAFMAWYSGNPYEQFMIMQPHVRARTRRIYWALIFCNVVVAAARSGSSSVRTSVGCAVRDRRIVVNVGMWLERFVIVVDQPAPRLPAVVVGHVLPDASGTGRRSSARIGLFLTLLFLFVRFLPMISIFEMRTHAARRPRSRRSRRMKRRASPTLRPDGRVRRRRPSWSTRPQRAHEAGYRAVDAYTPFPIEELAEALGLHHTRLPLLVLIGGIARRRSAASRCSTGPSVIDYPLNVGGRPLHSWPAFIPITFEMTILVAALAAVLGMLALNGLPMPYHPVFNVPRFALASRDRFFLCIEARDPQFDRDETRRVPRRAWSRARCREVERLMRVPRSSRRARAACSSRSLLAPAAGRTCTTSRSTSRSRASAFFADERAARPLVAGHGRARPARRGRRASTPARSTAQPVARASRCRSPRELLERGQRALQHLLLALPRPHRQRRRHDRAARLPAAAVVPHRPPAQRAGRLLLRRDHATASASCRTTRRRCRSRDRWAIVAYVRALQLSQHATLADVPADEQRAARRGSAAMSAGTAAAPLPRAGPRRCTACSAARSIVGASAGARRCALGGAVVDPTQFFRSYLVGFLFWIGIALGCLAHR